MSQRRLSEYLIAGAQEGLAGTGQYESARLWADNAPELWSACNSVYWAFQERKMDRASLARAIEFCREVTARVAHEVELASRAEREAVYAAQEAEREARRQAVLARKSAAC